MFRRVAGLCPAAHGPRLPAEPDDVVAPAHDRVRGDQQPRPLTAGFRNDAEQGREQGPVRPVQLRAAQLALRDGEMVAHDQDLCDLPRLRRPGRPSYTASRVISRNTNRKHMIGDHHGPTTARATLLVRAMDGILGTQNLRKVATECVSRCLTEWVRTATGERGSQRVGLRPDVDGSVDPHCRLKARNASAEVLLGRLTFTSLRERKAREHQQRPDCAAAGEPGQP